MNIHAKIPVRITGYGSPRAEHDASSEPQIREYFIGNQEAPVAVAQVTYYADSKRFAGFLFNSLLYSDTGALNEAVSAFIVETVLHAYIVLASPLPPPVSIPFVQGIDVVDPPFTISTNGDPRGWAYIRPDGDMTKMTFAPPEPPK